METSRDPVRVDDDLERIVPDDWPRQATTKIVTTVDAVRDKTTGPIITVATAVVYGVVGLTAAMILLFVLSIASIRLLTEAFGGRAWAAYLLIGSVLTIAGLICWWKRSSSTPDQFDL